MKTRVIMYLEEYARMLSEEIKELLEREAFDNDKRAGEEAKSLETKISDIRRAVAYLSTRNQFKD